MYPVSSYYWIFLEELDKNANFTTTFAKFVKLVKQINIQTLLTYILF
jgi:hypothetical protein